MIPWGLALLGFGAIGWGWYSARQMLHPQPRAFPAPDPFPAYKIVSLLGHDDLPFEVWVLEAPHPRGVIVACHGYGGSRLQLIGIAQVLRQRSYTVMVWDFPGHGTRRGPCTFGIHETRDVDAIVSWRNEQPELASLPLGAFGLSMGGAIACQAAARNPAIRGLVLDSAYANLYPIVARAISARYHLPVVPWAWLTWAGVQLALGRRLSTLDPAILARHLTQPLLLIHGQQDSTVPPDHARTILAGWRGPTESWIEPDAAHVGAYALDPRRYGDRLAAFLDRWLTASQPSSS